MASKKEDSEVISADEVKVLPPEIAQRVSTEISLLRSEHNITEEAIAELKERYSGLIIAGPEDKEGYILVQESRKNLKAIRIGIQKGFKRLREIAQLEVKNKIAAEKEVVAQISELEDPLYEQEKAYDAAKEKEKQDRAQRIERQGMERMQQMMACGAVLSDGYWVLGELMYEAVLVKSCDPDIYEGIYKEYKAIFDTKEADRLQKDADDKAAAAKLLKDQQEVAKQKAEVKKMRTEGRISFLESLGMKKNVMGNAWVYANQFVKTEEIEEKESQDWEVIIAGVKSGVEEAKELAKRAEQNRIIFADRFIRLNEWSSNGQSVYSKGSQWGTTADIIDMSDEDFEKLVAENDKYLAAREEEKQKEKEKELDNARLEGIGKGRRDLLSGINNTTALSDLQLGTLSIEEWSEAWLARKTEYDAEEKKKTDQTEKDRLELLGEKGRYEELVKYLKSAPIGEYRSSQYRTKVSPIRTFIEGLK